MVFLTHDMCPRGDDVRAILRLENRQAGVINKSKKDLAHIKRLPDVWVDKREKIFNGVPRSKWFDQVELGRSSYLERSYPFSRFLNSIKPGYRSASSGCSSTSRYVLIRGHGICQTSRHGVDFGTSQFLRPNNLPSGHFDQRWTTEERLSLVLHEDSIV